MREIPTEYGAMVEDFLEGRSSAAHFAEQYFQRFTSDTREFEPSVYGVLNDICLSAEAFEPDPEIRNGINRSHPGQSLDEPALQREVNAAWAKRPKS